MITGAESNVDPDSAQITYQAQNRWIFLIRSDLCVGCRQLIQDALHLETHSNSRWQQVLLTEPRGLLSLYRSHNDGAVGLLMKSYQGGCQCCGLLMQQLELSPTQLQSSRYTICCDGYTPHNGWLRIVYGHPSEPNFPQSFAESSMIALRRKNGSTATDDFGLPRKILPYQNPSMPQAFDQVRAWLKSCCDWDKACMPRFSTLPKRVLDLSLLDNSGSLLLYRTRREEAPYATLSYCWGQGRTLRTIPETLQKYEQEGIPLNNLPRTLKDAVVSASQLGFRYLWIDALCIVQGKEGDWLEQSAEMHMIYGNSGLNISASSAIQSDEGFLHPLPDLGVLVAQYYTGQGSPEKDHGSIYLWPEPAGATTIIELEANPIKSRAWVLQESLLSPRTVHYTRQGIVWECRCQCMAEVKQQFSNSNRKQEWQRAILQDRNTDTDSDCFGNTTTATTWSQWVSLYNTLDLTQSTDKLPAFGGIAKAFADRYKMTYAAGLWRERFVEGLLWMRDPRAKNLTKYDEYVAPSWSWASVQGEIDYHQWSNVLDSPNKVDILEINVKTVSDLFGQVSEGCFVARGYVQSIMIEKQPPPSALTTRYEPHVGRIKQGISGQLDSMSCILDQNSSDDLADVSCQCLHVGDFSLDGLVATAFLLLQEDDHEKQRYKRVGYAYINPWQSEVIGDKLREVPHRDLGGQQLVLSSLWTFESPRLLTISVY